MRKISAFLIITVTCVIAVVVGVLLVVNISKNTADFNISPIVSEGGSFEVTPSFEQLKVGDSGTLRVKGLSGKESPRVQWYSLDENVATVDSDGNVVAVGPGQTKIIGETDDGDMSVIIIDIAGTKEIGSSAKPKSDNEEKKATEEPIDKKPQEERPQEDKPQTKISINNSKVSLVKGESYDLVATITPKTAVSQLIVWKSSNSNIVSVDQNGKITAKQKGEATITATLRDGSSTSSCKVYVKNPSEYVKAHFYTFSGNQAILIESTDSDNSKKYILIDAGEEKVSNCNSLISYLKANVSTHVIDYFILSHSHSDHTRCVAALMNNKSIKIKKFIAKDESTAYAYTRDGVTYRNAYAYIKSNYLSHNPDAKLVNTHNLDKTVKGYVVNNHVNMYLHNLSDIYRKYTDSNRSDYVSGDKCGSKSGNVFNPKMYRSVRFSKYQLGANDGNKWIQLKQSDGSYMYPIVTSALGSLRYTKTPYGKNVNNPKVCTFNSDTKSWDCQTYNGSSSNFFYAFSWLEESVACDANANSIAVLFEIKTTSGKKYIYVPNDLENNGYPMYGKNGIYGQGGQYFFKYKDDAVYSNIRLVADSSKIVEESPEHNVAQLVKDRVKDNEIIAYQASHHGNNNAPDAIKLLGLNNSKVQVFATRSSVQYNGIQLVNARTSAALSNVFANQHYHITGRGAVRGRELTETPLFVVYSDGSSEVLHDRFVQAKKK